MKLSSHTRVFIAGCGGMLGEAVFERFSTRCEVLATDIDVNTDWLSHADVRDYPAIAEIVDKFAPHLIINLAALTDLEYCEQHQEDSWLTNALGAENLALLAAKADIPYVYISTAGIFDGNQEYYTDFDEPRPLSHYGKSKYYGERITQRMLTKHFVFRAGWMMGGGPDKDKKFINKIHRQIQSGSTDLNVVADKLGTPTYTVNFADSMFQVVETDLYGLYNMVCSGSCSRYDVAVEFVRLLGLEQQVTVNEVDSTFFSEEYFAPRPASEKLLNTKLVQRGINFMRPWEECLAEYAKAFT